MTLPTAFTDALADDSVQLYRWLEVAGIPRAWGTWAADFNFFVARSATEKFESILDGLGSVPAALDQEVDVLDGVAKTIGRVDFAFLDVSDEVSGWTATHAAADWLRLATDISESATSFTVFDSPNVANFPTSNGVLYIGLETITYASFSPVTRTFDGCLRGAYRSKPKAWGLGVPIALKPYSMRGRRCWYYQCAERPGVAPSDARKALRFAGTLEEFRLDSRNRGQYILGVESLERMLAKPIFRSLRTVTDTRKQGIAGPPWDMPGARMPNEPGGFSIDINNHSRILRTDTEDNGFPNFLLRVDDEFFQVAQFDSGKRLDIVRRGLLNTKADEHDAGFSGREVAFIAPLGGSAPPETLACLFRSAVTTESPLPAHHPLIVFLQLLLSTGQGTNVGSGQRNYDKLPEGWGLGVDVALVNVEGIESAAAEQPTLEVGGVWEDEVDFLSFARSNLLKPFGFFAYVDADGRWNVRNLRSAMPDETPRVVDSSSIIARSMPGFDANLQGVVDEVAFRYGKSAVRGTWTRVQVQRFLEARLYTDGEAQKLALDLPLMHAPGAVVPGAPSGLRLDVESYLLSRRDFYRQRYTRPAGILSLRVDYTFLGAEVGDYVRVSHSQLPSPRFGERGLADELGEVTSKRIDDRTKTVELTIALLGYSAAQYRRIAPAARVKTATALGGGLYELACYSNEYSDAAGGSDLDRFGAFAIGQVLIIRKPGLSRRSEFEVNSLDAGAQSLTVLALSGAHIPVADDVLVLADVTQTLFYFESRYAFGAPVSGEVFSNDLPAHLYVP